MNNVILIGAQGSGKGTQAQMLADQFHLKPCASGELLRDAIAKGTPLGQEAKPYYDRGDLVPDNLVIEMILEQIQHLDSAQGIILDGFPRNIPQARALDDRLEQTGQKINCVVYLEVPRETLADRLSGRYLCKAHGHIWNIKTHPPKQDGKCDIDGSDLYQRSDDTPEKVAHRLDIFFGETIRLLDYYDRERKLVRVDGTRTIEQVNTDIRSGCPHLEPVAAEGQQASS